MIEHAQQTILSPSKLVLNYEAYGFKVSVIEGLRGKSDLLTVEKLHISSLGTTEEHLLVAAIDSDGNILDADVTERLIGMPGHADAIMDQSTVSPPLQTEIDRQKSGIISALETRNLSFFAQETEKLDEWADDLKVGLEREIKELDRQIKEARTKGKGAATLADKLAAQKEQREHEGHRDKKRRELFDRQDEIQRKRGSLIDELERQLKQEIIVSSVLTCEWELM